MKSVTPFLRLFSDFLNGMLVLVAVLKRDYTLALLFAILMTLFLKLLADVYD